jgi:glutamine phosphoribosylpyrophosphate amidotransferase
MAGLRQAVNDKSGEFCTSCYTGVYPTDLVQLEVKEESEVTVDRES